jgi:ABC-2 type transport system ATP-binding protein
MESVEEICDHIALINKSKKILDGKVNEIKNTYRSNSYEIIFEGNMIAFSNALWTGFEILSTKTDRGRTVVKVKGTDDSRSVNSLIGALIKDVKIISVYEITPSMNDIFIQKVSEINPEDISEGGSDE